MMKFLKRCLLIFTAPLLHAQVSPLIVTTDQDNLNGGDNLVTLREAIESARNFGGAQTITFKNSPPLVLGEVDFSSGRQEAILMTRGAFNITTAITIKGPGADLLTLDAGQASRVFNFSENSAKSLSGLRLTKGAVGGDGGGIDLVGGSLTLDQCVVDNCFSNEGNGGGISSLAATLILNRCTLSGNMASGFTSNFGGGIYALNSNVKLTQCTVSQNTVSGNNSSGGGIFINAAFATSVLTLNQCTLSENVASSTGSRGGGISATNTNLNLANTIIANSTSEDVWRPTPASVTLNATGKNLIEDGSIPSGANVISGDPLLGVLANNGGRTATHLLQTGSPAVDAGTDSVIAADTFDMDADGNTTEPIPYDQRGFGPRSRNGVVDLGATEFGATGAEAPSLRVTTDSDATDAFDFQTSLREAINLAETTRGNKRITFSNDTLDGAINFYGRAPRTIALTQGQFTIGSRSNSFGYHYIIEGPGPDKLTLDAHKDSRIFELNSRDQVLISGLRLINGNVPNDPGGGILCGPDQKLRLSNCHLTDNSATQGGGIYLDRGINVVTFYHCLISDNSARSSGGGIHVRGLDSRQLVPSNDHTFFSMEECTVSNNRAPSAAGIYARNQSGTFSRSTISGNIATGNGGGILWDGFRSDVALEQCIISGNSAVRDSLASGGGIYCADSDVSLIHCTVNNNSSAATKGGGIHAQDAGNISLANTIVANSNGLDTFGILPRNLAGKNLVEDNSLIDSQYVINGDPRLGGLANNGGFTLTSPLFADSPAINAGDNLQAVNLLTDQRGSGFMRLSGKAVDIGAVEFPSPPIMVTSSLGRWRILHSLPEDGSQDLGNPAGDGVKNLLKYAFNLAPNAGDLLKPNVGILAPDGSAGLPNITRDADGRLRIIFLRQKSSNSPGITYTVETSTDLVTFTPLSLSAAGVSSIDSVFERVTVIDPTITPRRFGRVSVEKTTP